MRAYLISFDYDHYVTEDPGLAYRLAEISPVNKSYVDGKYIYEPRERETSVTLIKASDVRVLTKEEVENKALKEAQSSKQYYEKVAADRAKEIEELKYQIKALTKGDN